MQQLKSVGCGVNSTVYCIIKEILIQVFEHYCFIIGLEEAGTLIG